MRLKLNTKQHSWDLAPQPFNQESDFTSQWTGVGWNPVVYSQRLVKTATRVLKQVKAEKAEEWAKLNLRVAMKWRRILTKYFVKSNCMTVKIWDGKQSVSCYVLDCLVTLWQQSKKPTTPVIFLTTECRHTSIDVITTSIAKHKTFCYDWIDPIMTTHTALLW